MPGENDVAEGLDATAAVRAVEAKISASPPEEVEALRRALAIWCVAREPLSARTVARLARVRGATARERMFEVVSPLLAARGAEPDGEVAHAPASQAAAEAASGSMPSRAATEAHRTLGAWPPITRSVRPYVLRHGVHHLWTSGDAKGAERLGLGAFALVARCREIGPEAAREVAAEMAEVLAKGAAGAESTAAAWRELSDLLASEAERLRRTPLAVTALFHERLGALGWDPAKIAKVLCLPAGAPRLRRIQKVTGRAPEAAGTDRTPEVRACAIDAGEARAVTASADHTLRVLDAATGRELLTLEGHTAPVNACAFSPDGTTVASAADDGTVRLWEIGATPAAERVTSIVFNDYAAPPLTDAPADAVAEPASEGVAEPGSEGVAEPGSEGVAEPGSEGVVEPGSEGVAEPGSEGGDSPEPAACVYGVHVDTGGKRIVHAARRYPFTTLWVEAGVVGGAVNEAMPFVWTNITGAEVDESLALAEKLLGLETGPADSKVDEAPAGAGESEALEPDAAEPKVDAAPTGAGESEALESDAAEPKVDEAPTGAGEESEALESEAAGAEVDETIKALAGKIEALKTDATGAGVDETLLLLRKLHDLTGQSAGEQALSSPELQKLIEGEQSPWPPELQRLIEGEQSLSSPELQRLIEGEPSLTDALVSKLLREDAEAERSTKESLAARAFAVTPDGQHVIVADRSNVLVVEARYTGVEAQAAKLEGHTGPVTACAMSPDGQRLFTASLDGTLRVWDLPARKLLASTHAGPSPITGLSITPDGRRLLSASADGLAVWDAAATSRDAAAPVRLESYPGDAPFTCVAARGRRVVAGDASGATWMFELSDPDAKGAGAVLATGRVQRRHALVVGVRNHRSSSIAALPFSNNDARELSAVLEEHDYHVVTLHDEQPEPFRRPTRENIRDELSLLRPDPDDLVLVHFSCHGARVGGTAHLLASDTEPERIAETAIAVDEVIDRMKATGARRLVLVLDACYTGVSLLGRGGDGPRLSADVLPPSVPDDSGHPVAERPPRPELGDPTFVRDAFDLAEGFALLAASTAAERSFDRKTVPHSLFTSLVIEGLGGKADLDRKGFVTVDDLKTWLLSGAAALVRGETKLAQNPTFQVQGKGDMVLTRR